MEVIVLRRSSELQGAANGNNLCIYGHRPQSSANNFNQQRNARDRRQDMLSRRLMPRRLTSSRKEGTQDAHLNPATFMRI